MDITVAYMALTDDEKWKSKILVYGILFAITLVLDHFDKFIKNYGVLISIFASILLTILTFLLSGFMIQTIKNTIRKKANFIPDLKENIKTQIIIGFKYSVAIAIILISSISPCIIGHYNKDLMIIMAVISIFLMLTSLSLIPALTIEFAKDYNFATLFNFEKALDLIKKRKISNYVKLLFLLFLMTAMIRLVSLILTMTIVGIIAVPFINVCAIIMGAHLHGQFFELTNQTSYEIPTIGI